MLEGVYYPRKYDTLSEKGDYALYHEKNHFTMFQLFIFVFSRINNWKNFFSIMIFFRNGMELVEPISMESNIAF